MTSSGRLGSPLGNASALRRIGRVLERLALHGLGAAALTGSVASMLHGRRLGAGLRVEAPQDVDLVFPAFDAIPRSLGGALLCWHVHPDALPGRLWLQLVDPLEAIRIDIFGARGAALDQSETYRIGKIDLQVLSLEDVVANTARLLLDLSRGEAVARKHLVDFERLRPGVDIDRMEAVWPDYRRRKDPLSYRTAAAEIGRVTAAHPELLTLPRYGAAMRVACPRCRTMADFPRASAAEVRGLLGYV